MMTTRQQVQAQARTWIGTPHVHQAATKGVGVDCGKLPGAVGMELGIFPPDFWTRIFVPFEGYERRPDGTLADVLAIFLEPIALADVQPGDVVLMLMPRETQPSHVGILTDLHGLGLLHAWSSGTAGKVVEHALDLQWRRRIVAAYALPGVD